MAREFTVRVYEDHYLVEEADGAPIPVERGALEATLTAQDPAMTRKAARRRGGRPAGSRNKAKAELVGDLTAGQ